MPVFSPAILAAAAAAAPATPVSGATAETPPSAPGAVPKGFAGYSVLYVAFDGCGDPGGVHDFANLAELEAVLKEAGGDLAYVNVEAMPKELTNIPEPLTYTPQDDGAPIPIPGVVINRNFDHGAELLDRYNKPIFSADVLLIRGDVATGSIVGTAVFNSKSDNEETTGKNEFVDAVTAAIRADQAQVASRQR